MTTVVCQARTVQWDRVAQESSQIPVQYLYKCISLAKAPGPIIILPANMRHRLVGNENPQMVLSVEPVTRAGQLHLRRVSRASVIKPTNSKAGSTHFSNTLALLSALAPHWAPFGDENSPELQSFTIALVLPE